MVPPSALKRRWLYPPLPAALHFLRSGSSMKVQAQGFPAVLVAITAALTLSCTSSPKTVTPQTSPQTVENQLGDRVSDSSLEESRELRASRSKARTTAQLPTGLPTTVKPAVPRIAGVGPSVRTAQKPVAAKKEQPSVKQDVRPRPRSAPLVATGASWQGVKLPAIMLRIRSCESGRNGYATHGHAHDYNYAETNPRSSASGAWQFLDSTWRYVSKQLGLYLPGRAKNYSRALQDRVAMQLYRTEGTRPWAASRACWGR